MKRLCLVLAIVLLAGCAWGMADSEDLNKINAHLWVPIDDLAGDITSEQISIPLINSAEIADILKRCLDFVPDDPPGVYYVGDNEDKRRRLRRDIEAAIKILLNE